MKILVDMDGVVADFIKHFNEVMLTHYPEHTAIDNIREAKLKLADTAPNFWDEIPPMPDAKQLMNYLKGKDFEMLTAYAEWMPASKKAKPRWMWKHFGVPPSKMNVVKRPEKKLYATDENGNPNILIDDYEKNIKEFKEAGGYGIVHVGASSTIAKLEKLLKNEKDK